MNVSIGALLFVAALFLSVGILIGRAIRAVNLALTWDAGHAVGKAVGYATRAAEEQVPRPSEAMYPIASGDEVAAEFEAMWRTAR